MTRSIVLVCGFIGGLPLGSVGHAQQSDSEPAQLTAYVCPLEGGAQTFLFNGSSLVGRPVATTSQGPNSRTVVDGETVYQFTDGRVDVLREGELTSLQCSNVSQSLRGLIDLFGDPALQESYEAELREAKAQMERRLAQALLTAESYESKAASLEERLEEQTTVGERRAALLSVARAELAEQEDQTERARREVEALNHQVSELRRQVGTLQSLLDVADKADEQAELQIQALGERLNTALARAADEERRRRSIEQTTRQSRAETAELQRCIEAAEELADAKGCLTS